METATETQAESAELLHARNVQPVDVNQEYQGQFMDTSGDRFFLYQVQTEVFKIKWRKCALPTWKKRAPIKHTVVNAQ